MITAKVLADSISPEGNRILTIESEYPRFIHAQTLKHRMHSVNTSSSRAVPTKRWVEMVRNNSAMPVKFGKNQSGMVSGEEQDRGLCESLWHEAAESAIKHAMAFADAGVHKEITNRIIEPFMVIKEVRTATEWNNLFHLRIADDAQGEINLWARAVYDAINQSTPQELKHGEWHLPYIKTVRKNNTLQYYSLDGNSLTLEEAKAISASCCAQVSYRRLNTTPEKALDIYSRLMPEDGNLHATPFEHQATPLDPTEYQKRLKFSEEIGDIIPLFKGNLRGWFQHRKEFANENKTFNF